MKILIGTFTWKFDNTGEPEQKLFCSKVVGGMSSKQMETSEAVDRQKTAKEALSRAIIRL